MRLLFYVFMVVVVFFVIIVLPAAAQIPTFDKPFDVIPHDQPGDTGEHYFHGPATIVVENGDLLVTTAWGGSHGHGIGKIVQTRSTDGGKTWQYEGVIYDHGEKIPGGSCYNPDYGLAPDGSIILMVQTTSIKALGKGEKAGFTGYVYLISTDHGRTYEYKGFVDPDEPQNVESIPSPIIARNGTLHFVSFSYEAGVLLYTSQNNGRTWKKRSSVFHYHELSPVFYPTLTFLPDGSLYVMVQQIAPDWEERNYVTISRDDGITWDTPRFIEGISVRHPVLNWLGDVLVVHGRHTPLQDVVIHYSFDNGSTWTPGQIIEDYDTDGGYSSSVFFNNRLFICFSSDNWQQPPQTDMDTDRINGIRGVFVTPHKTVK
ncbi:sialidase family protein [Candidatus Latescibacterota bacterium]